MIQLGKRNKAILWLAIGKESLGAFPFSRRFTGVAQPPGAPARFYISHGDNSGSVCTAHSPFFFP